VKDGAGISWQLIDVTTRLPGVEQRRRRLCATRSTPAKARAVNPETCQNPHVSLQVPAMAKADVAVDCSYELDQYLTITTVGAGWDEFALANSAPELLSPAPIGRPLLLFIADSTTAHLYERLFKRVADTKRSVTVPIRCDSPELRRYLTLTIAPGVNGFVVSTHLVRLEARKRLTMLTSDLPRHEGSLVMCGWCKRAEVKGKWLEIEDAVAALRLFERRTQPLVQYGICEDCHQRVLALIDDTASRRG
jgi:hypothetical protein